MLVATITVYTEHVPKYVINRLTRINILKQELFDLILHKTLCTYVNIGTIGAYIYIYVIRLFSYYKLIGIEK